MTANTSRWKMLSSVTVFANLLCVACGNTSPSVAPETTLAVRGAVERALLADGDIEVSSLWHHSDNNDFILGASTAVDGNGDFRLELPDAPPEEALLQFDGDVLAASGYIHLTVDGAVHAQSDQILIFVSKDADFDEIAPDSKLGYLTAGYHLGQTNDAGEPEIIPFDSTVTFDLNSPLNCSLRLSAELTACQEEAEQDADASDSASDICLDAHDTRLEACAAGE
jgi:hypothetical protein